MTPEQTNVHGGFIMFPISALSCVGTSPDEVPQQKAVIVLQTIRAFSVWSLAQKLQAAYEAGGDIDTPYNANSVADLHSRHMERYSSSVWQEYFLDDADENETIGVAAALEMLNMNVDVIKPLGSTVAVFAEKMETLSTELLHDGGRKWVSIRADLFDDATDGQFTWREFAVLVAIYAALGDKKSKAEKLYYEQLAAMASGYGGQHVAADMRVPADKFLTRRQIRYTIDALWQRGLFAKVPSGRGMWFSIRMKESALMQYVANVESRVKLKKKSAAFVRAETQKKTSQNRQQKVASSVAPKVAPKVAPTGETLSGETFSGETLSGETSGQQIADASLLTPDFSSRVTEEIPVTKRSVDETPNAATFVATLQPQSVITGVTHSNAVESRGSFLASCGPKLRNELEALQRLQDERRAACSFEVQQ